ncbi:MAG: SDR family oxidoreductase [Arcanobacterium sp.]|nr:SDR family oxidoreductase [Arcanobacterium sp.]MDY5589360.1 SDR family oxidoreductase [Arcanobacterium sp.]
MAKNPICAAVSSATKGLFPRPIEVPLKGAVVLVTGAGSGIGRLMAVGAARRGAKGVIVWDLNETGAKETARLAESAAASASLETLTAKVDVTDADSVSSAAQAALQHFGRVDILINNAGIVTGKEFLKLSDADVQRTFAVNTLSHYRTTREFLPGMIERDKGSVVTIASAAGLVGVARQTDYAGSKFGAVGFAQSLRAELRHHGSHVHTLVYCPYYIGTGMFEGVTTKFKHLLPILRPEQAAEQVLDAIEAGTQMKVNPPIVRLVQLLQPFPVPFVDRVLDIFGINSTMNDFVGRTAAKK